MLVKRVVLNFNLLPAMREAIQKIYPLIERARSCCFHDFCLLMTLINRVDTVGKRGIEHKLISMEVKTRSFSTLPSCVSLAKNQKIFCSLSHRLTSLIAGVEANMSRTESLTTL
ncbi:hypothetical protein CDAR_239361 [Caerostris darwini]|uniref:Uncharacterized protein n=1 Tax=Caerostris darwini TaxID=1538125 RepID=A0AAV4SSD5_9ARAC|nr:hypothetical protein CDAR_239361 [Caerostris darwini]